MGRSADDATYNRSTGLARGRGWVEQTRAGRWQARPGRGVPSLGTFDTKAAAIHALANTIEVPVTGTLSAYVEQFIRLRATRWEAGTLGNYRWYTDLKITPAIGHLHLHEIDQRAINEWWIDLCNNTGAIRNGELSSGRATCAKTWKFLRQVLRAADRDGLIVHPICDPVENATRENSPERVLLTGQQVQGILAHLPPNRQIIAILAATCGLRWGEVLGLRRQHIDHESRTISIQRVVSEDKRSGRKSEKEPKTNASRRLVPVHPSVIRSIELHMEQHVSDPSPRALLVTTRNGTSVSRSTWSPQWRRAVESAGLDGLRPALSVHDLRHHCLTMVSTQTNQIREVMAFAGHSSTSAALRYQHAAASDLQHLARPFAEQSAQAVRASSVRMPVSRPTRKRETQ